MEKEVLASWDENADEWIKVLESQKIQSRAFTNKAIIKTLSALPISKILDCGCGEGWLTRSLSALGKDVVGIDATSRLIKKARQLSADTFYELSYEQIIDGESIPEHPFNAIVFNFCLYQKIGLEQLLKKIKGATTKNGFIIVQTIHPHWLKGQNLPYKSQWIKDSWLGLPGNFVNGHSWYARTFEDWISVFKNSGLRLHTIKEVTDTQSEPISVIFVLN